MENIIPLKNPLDDSILRLTPAGERAIGEYLSLHPVPTGNDSVDDLLDGGLEQGNFYLCLGPAKSGKSSFLRSIALTISRKTPVLYLNFEQLGRSTFSSFYGKLHGESLRTAIRTNPIKAAENVEKMPGTPLYVAFWTDALENKSFNVGIRATLEASVKWIFEKEGELPVVVMENLSDIYNERIGGQDSLTNVVSQTIMDVKSFCIRNEVAMFLAHHTSKTNTKDERPTVDDVRDSKRVVDLAHSIFCSWTVDLPDDTVDYRFSFLRGRESPGSKHFYIFYEKNGDCKLVPYKKVPEKKRA